MSHVKKSPCERFKRVLPSMAVLPKFARGRRARGPIDLDRRATIFYNVNIGFLLSIKYQVGVLLYVHMYVCMYVCM